MEEAPPGRFGDVQCQGLEGIFLGRGLLLWFPIGLTGGYNYPVIQEFIDFPEVLRLRLDLRILKSIALLTSSLLFAGTAMATTTQTKSSTPSKSSKSTSSSHKSSNSSKSGKTSTSKAKGKKSAKGTSHGQKGIDQERTVAIQQALAKQGYLAGEPTGKFDQSTKDALVRFQAENGWQTKVTPDSRALIKLGLGPDKKGLLNPDTAVMSSPHELGTQHDTTPGGSSQQ